MAYIGSYMNVFKDLKGLDLGCIMLIEKRGGPEMGKCAYVILG